MAILAMAFSAAPAAEKAVPVLKVTGGRISGVWSEKHPQVAIYKGIPYAAPPVGELRWKKPQPVRPWQGVRACDHYGAASLQADLGPMGANKGVGVDYVKEFYQDGNPVRSEDCLYLNVFTTSPKKKPLKPVMVWIHGGSFDHGWGHEIEFDGDGLAQQGVVLVTINYRVGILGFLAHPLLTAENGGRGSGNYGIYDQMAALQWVKENIRQFGGDPDCITVFGQSAGAGSVQTIISSPMAKGLVKRAIIQSGGGYGGIISAAPLKEAEAVGKEVMDLAGAHTLAEMRALPADSMVSLYAKAKQLKSTYRVRMAPCIDGELLQRGYQDVADRGEELDIPYMIGYTSDDIAPQVMQKSAMAWSRKLEEQGRRPAYVYHFDYKLPGDNAGAFHSSELWFVFGSLHNCWRPFPPAADDLANRMMGYWTNFARTGNPNGKGLPEWAPCTRQNPHEQLLTAE